MRCKVCLWFILAFLHLSLYAGIIFTSDFECGRTFLKEDALPGRDIQLVPNQRLLEWPAEGGEGFIFTGAHREPVRFTYSQRTEATLIAISGITDTLPEGSLIQTRGFLEWNRQDHVENVSIESDVPVSGLTSARLDSNASLVHDIAPINEFYLRFYARFSEELYNAALEMGRDNPGKEWMLGKFLLEVTSTTTNGWAKLRLFSFTGKKCVLMNDFHIDKGNIRYFGKQEIFPDSTYCIELHYRALSQNQGGYRMWINGVAEPDSLCYATMNMGDLDRLKFGTWNKFGYVLDDVVMSTERIGMKPAAPVITLDPLPGITGHGYDSIQWQADPRGDWFFPRFNRIFAADSMPLVKADDKEAAVKVRARVQQNGKWGHWSRQYGVKGYGVILDSERSGIIKSIRIGDASPDGGKVIRGRMNRLRILFKDSHAFMAASSVTLNFSAPSNEMGTVQKYSGVFDSSGAYHVHFGKSDKWNVHAKMIQDLPRSREVTRRHTGYIDATDSMFRVDSAASSLSVGFKFFENAEPGLWRVRAVTHSADKANGPWVYRGTVLVTAVHAGAGIGPEKQESWQFLLVLLILMPLSGFVLILMIRRRLIRETSRKRAVYSDSIRLAMEYIQTHYSENVKLEQIAQASSLSPNWLATQFKKETGKTVNTFLNQTRIQEAVKLLKSSAKSASEIGYTVGFNDPSYFVKVFKNATGKTPGEYRESL
jgi:AraC-like DNA-binding protein